jgi:hypothetical protein
MHQCIPKRLNRGTHLWNKIWIKTKKASARQNFTKSYCPLKPFFKGPLEGSALPWWSGFWCFPGQGLTALAAPLSFSPASGLWHCFLFIWPIFESSHLLVPVSLLAEADNCLPQMAPISQCPMSSWIGGRLTLGWFPAASLPGYAFLGPVT